MSTMNEPAVLDLSHSDGWLLEAEPDATRWSVGDVVDELEDGEPVHPEYGVPLGDDDEVSIPAWNLGSSSLRGVAVAAAFVPLLSIAEPAFAAPPTSVVVVGPSEAPAPEPTAWEGLVQHRVLITTQEGATFRGTVLSVTNGVLVCARDIDGLMVLVDPAQIQSVNVEALPGQPAPKPPANGQGMIIMGSIGTAIGSALLLGTLAVGAACTNFGAYYYDCSWYTLPLGVSTAVSLAVGIPVLAAGLSKRKKSRAREDSAPQMSAFVAPGREGAMVGVGMRF
jgi:hypothetical protein